MKLKKLTKVPKESRMHEFLVAILFMGFVAHPAIAFEGRHSVDPSVVLQDLREMKGVPQMRKERSGRRIIVDSSALLDRVDPEKLVSEAMRFDDYVAMGMPHLKSSRVVATSESENILHVWSHMVLSALGVPFSSKHYIRVHRLPTGSEWELEPKQQSWPFPESSALEALDGSWYVQTLGQDEAYVRYWLSMEPDVAPAIVDSVVGGQLQSGVRKVIEALARQAAL